MKANLPKTSVVVLIVALLLSMWMSTRLAQQRSESAIHARSRDARAGFGKFLSQVGWMRLLQYRGSIAKIEKEDAQRLARRYDALTDLDPMFARAYEEGALDIQFESPEEALRLLDKAMAVDKLNNWRIPYTAGFICKFRLKDTERALRYFEQAAKAADHPSYIDRSVVYLKADRAKNEPMAVLNLWADYYGGGPGYLFREDQAATAGRFVMEGGYNPRIGNVDDRDRAFAAGRIRQLSAQIVGDARKRMAGDASDDEKKTWQARIDHAQKIVAKVGGGSHICPQCFRPYQAGDRFCSSDGTKLDVYGVCPKDGETIVQGPYCHKCGAKAN